MSDIIGSKGGEKEHVHYEAPDSLHSTSYARVLDLVSEGEILGLTNGLQSVYLNDTPVQNADGTSNFTGVTIDFRTGTQTQDYIPGFPSVENEVGVGVELKSTTPWVHAISNTSLSAIRITLGVPSLSQSDTKNGDVKGYKIDYRIELAKDGGAYAVVLTSSFNGKTTTAYQRSARIDLPAATAGWQVRVTRITANANTAAIADATTIISYTEVVDGKLRYPMSAIVGVQVDAKQFQNVPKRAYDLMGRIVQVPSNYNAKTRAYTGNWDGTFEPSWTDNPAWIFRDLALNDRYGLGHRIAAAQVDKWSLYAIARYCDGMVPNGKGGTEPRFTCNLYLQTQKQAYAVLQDLASIFRGISYWGAGSIIASADMPTDPVYVYTAANVIGGKFSRVGTSKKTRYTTALVSWNDPADMYKAKVEYTEDPEGITRYGIQQVSLTAFGCSSQGQAQRVGRWALATSRLETEAISFDVGMDGAIALPGQIIRVADPSRMGRRNGGRIKTASGRVVVLDKAPTINAGDKLTIILPTGKSETRTVVSVGGDAVTVDADWTALPVAQSVWSVDSTVLIAPTYKVRSVVEKDAVTYTISATQHEPGKFDFIENGTAITPRPQTALNAAVQQPPTAVTVDAYTVSLQDVQKLGFIATCAAVGGAVAYEGAFQHDNSNWFTLPRQPGPVFDVLDVLAGYYTVKIAAVNALGITSIETVSTSTLVSKNANPKNAGILLTPSAQGFNVNSDGSITPASITVHADLLALEGNVTWSAVGATITSSNNNATIVATNMPGAAMTLTASLTALGQTFTRSIDIVKSADGAAGADKYVWIKYGTSAAGAGLTDNPDGMTYIGIAVNKSSAIESTVATDYTWSSVSGPAGTSTFTGVTYLQQLAQPSTPTGGTFNFTTSVLTPPAGWSATQPTSSTVPTWAVRYTFTAATLGATVTAGTWSTPTSISQNGSTGAPGVQSMVVFLYQYNTATPAAPNGTSTLNWVTGVNSSYNGSDSWSTQLPANPGTPGLRTYVATQPVTALGGTTSTTAISYASAGISALGTNGNNGANGAQSATPTVYQRAVTIPAGPVGSNTYTWATGLFGAAPPSWSLAPGAAVPGSTLWAAKVSLVDTSAAATTGFNWSAASIVAQGYDGGNGTIGADGLSYVTAYCASTTSATSTTPAATTGKASVPAVNGGGITGTWTAAVPTLATNERMWNTDGIYNPATNQVTWSIPYWSVFKVGSISAISANFGAMTAGQIDLGSAGNSWHVDPSGNMWAGASTFAAAPFSVSNTGAVISRSQQTFAADGTLLFSTGAGLTLAGAPAGTLNSNVNVAGRNLVVDSAFDRGLRPWTTKSAYVSSVDIRGAIGERYLFIQSVAATGADNDVYVNGDGPSIPVAPGKSYVIAFDYATAQSSSITNSSCYMYQSSGGGFGLSLPVLDTGSARLRSMTLWTCPAGVTSLMPRFGIHTTGYAWLAIYNFMVAEGNKDTGWIPAPEDSLITTAAAAASALAANNVLAAIADDNVLAKSEKSQVVADWDAINAERFGIIAQAAALGVSSTSYQASADSLSTYLISINYNGLTVDTPVVGATFRSNFVNYYAAKQALLNLIAAKTATMSTWAGTSGTGKPADNATADATFLTRGNITLTGNTAVKASGNAAWDSDVYSKEGFVGGAVAQAVVGNISGDLMFGLNADPLTDGSYTSLDYAIRCNGSALEWWTSGSGATLGTSVAVGDVLAVAYDGSNVRWLKNGAVLKTVAAAITAPLYFDSSFNAIGSSLTGMRFIPQSSNAWGSIGGTGKPENNATVGGTFGAGGNITGQMTVAQVPNFIPANGITDVLIGGNLKSTNWNGDTGANGMGFLLERATGFIYCGGMKARGAVMGGAYTSYAWPASGAGFYAGPEGFKCGTVASNRYFNADQFGDIYAPGFTVINSQVTVTDAILVRPKIGDNVTASISGGGYYVVTTNVQFTEFYVGTYTASMTNSSGNLAYSWSSTSASGFTTRVSSTQGATIQVYATGKLFQGQELDFFVNCTITDLNSSVSRPAQAISQIAANT